MPRTFDALGRVVVLCVRCRHPVDRHAYDCDGVAEGPNLLYLFGTDSDAAGRARAGLRVKGATEEAVIMPEPKAPVWAVPGITKPAPEQSWRGSILNLGRFEVPRGYALQHLYVDTPRDQRFIPRRFRVDLDEPGPLGLLVELVINNRLQIQTARTAHEGGLPVENFGHDNVHDRIDGILGCSTVEVLLTNLEGSPARSGWAWLEGDGLVLDAERGWLPP